MALTRVPLREGEGGGTSAPMGSSSTMTGGCSAGSGLWQRAVGVVGESSSRQGRLAEGGRGAKSTSAWGVDMIGGNNKSSLKSAGSELCGEGTTRPSYISLRSQTCTQQLPSCHCLFQRSEGIPPTTSRTHVHRHLENFRAHGPSNQQFPKLGKVEPKTLDGMRHTTANSKAKIRPHCLRGPDHSPNFLLWIQNFPAHGHIPQYGIHEARGGRIGET